MFAIVVVGGKQYRAEEGRDIVVDRMDAPEGATIQLEPALIADGDDVRLGTQGAAEGTVTAKVVEHFRGPKGKVLRHKPKKSFLKRAGYRAELTRLAIEKIV